MKKLHKILAFTLAVSLFCLTAAACSNGENNDETTTENNIPISMELSEPAQTTPEIVVTEETTIETTEQTSAAEITESTENTENTENTETADETTTENSETSIIGETTTATDAAPMNEPDISIGGVTGEGSGIVELALSMEGKPFYYGAASPDIGFDNSGLMYYVLNQNGVKCPRLTKEIAEWGEKVTYDELKPGYLVFFEYEGSGKADFGGIYVGDGYMIVSTDEDRPVSKTNIATDYYKKTFQFGIKTF